jgi:hypothetical protein
MRVLNVNAPRIAHSFTHSFNQLFVCRPTMRQAMSEMDLQWRLGLDPEVVKRNKTVSGWLWFKRAKSRNPFAVALVKVMRHCTARDNDPVWLSLASVC